MEVASSSKCCKSQPWMLCANTHFQTRSRKSFNITSTVKMCWTSRLFKTSFHKTLHRLQLLMARHKRTQISPHLRSGHRSPFGNIFDNSKEALRVERWKACSLQLYSIGCQSDKHCLVTCCCPINPLYSWNNIRASLQMRKFQSQVGMYLLRLTSMPSFNSFPVTSNSSYNWALSLSFCISR